MIRLEKAQDLAFPNNVEREFGGSFESGQKGATTKSKKVGCGVCGLEEKKDNIMGTAVHESGREGAAGPTLGHGRADVGHRDYWRKDNHIGEKNT